jgi:hypothetical protein
VLLVGISRKNEPRSPFLKILSFEKSLGRGSSQQRKCLKQKRPETVKSTYKQRELRKYLHIEPSVVPERGNCQKSGVVAGTEPAAKILYLTLL